MAYEILSVETVGDEIIKLVRKGTQFRLLGTPRWAPRKVQPAALAVRRTFRTATVAWCAFDLAVASERLWAATLGGHPRAELADAHRRAAGAFRTAAMRHRDPPGAAALAEVIAAGGEAAQALVALLG